MAKDVRALAKQLSSSSVWAQARPGESPTMKPTERRRKRVIQWIALAIGVACLIAAVWINATYQVDFQRLMFLAAVGDKQSMSVPNWLPTGTALGLSIAGGLCILGACKTQDRS